jgi:DNA invertase Pin-like site-specific DNA recombinase
MAEGAFVAYYRVSTERQGKSGLGLEAQCKAVEDFLNGGNWRLVAEFTEIESGKQAGRPALTKAFQACRLRRRDEIEALTVNCRYHRELSFIAHGPVRAVPHLPIGAP